MADISADFTDDFSRYEQVVFQRGKPILDAELNEMGRIASVREKRLRHNDDDYIPKTSHMEYVVPQARDMRIFTSEEDGVGTDQVRLGGHVGNKAQFTAYGYTFRLPAEGVLLDTVENTGNDPTFQDIYFTIKEEEITSAAASNQISVEELGETAIRKKLIVTWFVGDEDTDASQLYSNNTEPWEGTEHPVLVAKIHRPPGAIPTEGNQVVPYWRQNREMTRFNDRFFIGPVTLRSSIQSSNTDSASASYNNGTGLNIVNLAATFGFHMRTQTASIDSFWTVLIDGFYTVPAGHALVAVVPSQVPEDAVPNIDPVKPEYKGVIGTPGPGELELKVVDARGLGPLQILDNPTYMDNMVVICANMGGSLDQKDTDYDIEIVFADGKRIVRANDARPNTLFLGNANVTWGHGNRWEDELQPHEAGPTTDTDIRPRRRNILPPSDGSVKLWEEQTLRPSTNDNSDLKAGRLVMDRTYFARRYAITVEGNVVRFTGFIKTTNAVIDPTVMEWRKDDSTLQSTISYDGIDDNVNTPIGTLVGWASSTDEASPSWGPDEWEDASGFLGAVHLYRSGTGSFVSTKDSSASTVCGPFHALKNTTAGQPVRTGGSTPVRDVGSHYACTIPTAYGLLYTDGAGGVTVLNGSFNIESASVSDPQAGAPDPNSRAYITVTFKNPPPNPENIVISLTLAQRSTGLHLADWLVLPYNLAPWLQGDGTLRIYLAHQFYGTGDNRFQRGLAVDKYTVSLTVHGGWAPE